MTNFGTGHDVGRCYPMIAAGGQAGASSGGCGEACHEEGGIIIRVRRVDGNEKEEEERKDGGAVARGFGRGMDDTASSAVSSASLLDIIGGAITTSPSFVGVFHSCFE